MKAFKILLGIIFLTCLQARGQEHFIQGADSVNLFIIEKGEGPTMFLIPGWTMTSRFFHRQMEVLSDEYHLITYDPRGQGESDKPLTHNSYVYHARDIQEIFLAKELNEVILVGWSSGCLTVYEYLSQFGTDRLSKLILIDEPPKWVGDVSSEWVYGDFDGYRRSLKNLLVDINREKAAHGIINWMLKKPIEASVKSWMTEEILKTPDHTALSLYVDGVISDYNEVVSQYAPRIPMLFMVRESWVQQAKSWLHLHASDAAVVPISSHAMFWEEPEAFNRFLLNFVEKN